MGSPHLPCSWRPGPPEACGCEMADGYTELEKAVVVLVENFYKYVSKHSLVKNKISKGSFRKMLQKELNHMLTVRPPPNLSAPPAPPSPHPHVVPFLPVASVFSEWPPQAGVSPTLPDPCPLRVRRPDRGFGWAGFASSQGSWCSGPSHRSPVPGALWGRCPALLTPPPFLSRTRETERLLTSSSRAWTPTTMDASASTSTGP